MEEIFELIKAFNRLKEKIIELIGKIDLLLKSESSDANDGYIEEDAAAKFLHVSARTMARLRKKSLPYVKVRRRVLYKTEDLKEYIDHNSKR